MDYKRKPGESMASGVDLVTTIGFRDAETLRSKLVCILSALEEGLGHPTHDLEAAIDYVSSLEVTSRDIPEAYEVYRSFVVSPGFQRERSEQDLHPRPAQVSPEREIPNPAVRRDFFDTLRQLDEALRELSRQIRTVNDPARITPEVRAARAYVDAFREFLDVECGQAPSTIPKDLPNGLLVKIRKIDWATISDSAHKWAELIVKILMRL